MSINKVYNSYYELECDFCGEVKDSFNDFDDAVYYKKENGWRSVKDKHNNWADKCPDCQQQEAANSFECWS